MNEDAGTQGPGRSADQLERLAYEAGRIVGRTMQQAETTSRQLYGIASREARGNAMELKRRASVVMDEARNELPRVRAELREMHARVRERLK
jgi:hypothetical protein